jgi:hypothetical protein
MAFKAVAMAVSTAERDFQIVVIWPARSSILRVHPLLDRQWGKTIKRS